MSCCCRRQPKPAGHIVLVNAPHGALIDRVYKALEARLPVKVLGAQTEYLPGVDYPLSGTKSVLGTKSLPCQIGQSALYLSRQGQTAVIDLRDPSHAQLAHAAKALGGNDGLVTAVLVYVPLAELLEALQDVTMEDVVQYAQEFGHFFRGAFEPSRDTVDTLTRDDLARAFAAVEAKADADDRASLGIARRFLSAWLGLDVQPEVHLEPRLAVYDAVLRPDALARGANGLLDPVRPAGGASALRGSAVHYFNGEAPPAIPACAACRPHLPPAAATDPNGRLRSNLPPCGTCLGLARKQLLSSSLLAAQPALIRSQSLRQGLDGSALAADPWPGALRYNEVFQKSSKNSNARCEGLMDQLLYHRIRSLELDVRAERGALLWKERAPNHDWWMTHGTMGNLYECHQLDKLSEVLGILRTFHDQFPNHEVITLFLNVHDNFGDIPTRGHKPADFDALLCRVLGADCLFTPRQLKRAQPTIQAGAKKGWPSLQELRGKFVPVVVAGAAGYADAQDIAENMKCFVAKQNVPHTDLISRHNWVVFFDQNSETTQLSRDIEKEGFVSRQWVESQYNYQQALRKRAHHLATRCINYHHNPWAKTHTPQGYPFLPFVNGHKGFDSVTAAEPTRVIVVRATTGPLWGMQDNAVFASREDRTKDGQWMEYQWLGSSANTHMNKWARAGFGFRSSKDDDGAPYFALVMPAKQALPAQVQLRSHSDGPTTASPARSPAAAMLKVRCRYNGNVTDCEAYASEDGKKYRLIRSTTVPARLTHHGMLASSHGPGKNFDNTQYRFLFANLRRDGQPLAKADFPALSELGTVYRTPGVTDGLEDDVHGRELNEDEDEYAYDAE